MKVQLWTGPNGAGPVGEANLPAGFTAPPKVIMWNSRVFVLEGGAGRYVEAVACLLAPTEVTTGIRQGGNFKTETVPV